MSACPALDYAGVTAANWTAIKAEVLSDYHVAIAADAGTASGDGFTLGWNYVPATEQLVIQCDDSPFWASCSLINSTIDGLVKKCLGAP